MPPGTTEIRDGWLVPLPHRPGQTHLVLHDRLDGCTDAEAAVELAWVLDAGRARPADEPPAYPLVPFAHASRTAGVLADRADEL